MKILTVIDSMKGSLTSQEANAIVADSFREETLFVEEVAIADGGEGTVAAFLSNLKGERIVERCHNLYGKKMMGTYGWIPSQKLAIIETAETCGIHLLDGTEQTHPENTHSFGLAEQILSAMNKGAKKIIVGLGGTGTIDGGIGVLHGLGVRFLDSLGKIVEPVPKNFHKIRQFDASNLVTGLEQIEFVIAADVASKIIGDTGAVYMFGQQKGLLAEEMPDFENKMTNYSQVLLEGTNSEKGDGAAGGIGLALRRIVNARMCSGLELLAQYSSLEDKIKHADLVITGEGMIDSQSMQGKVPVGIAHIAQKYHKPVIAFVGSVQGDPEDFKQHGLSVIIPLIDQITTLEEAMLNAKDNLKRVATRTKATLLLLSNEARR
ncbi:glycerate 2-kinase [Enterococcus sp. AZ194]|uniref:glycerate kinase n=1 Tax=Enterococcus sp. AZ194 TaxID=2774629 RepID=UPI003F23926F